MIVAYIDVYKEQFGVEPICRVLSEHGMPIAPSTYYAHVARRVSDADWDDAHLANRLLDLWRANRSVYGIDKLAAAARRAGLALGRDHVGRLMGIVGISGALRGRHRRLTTRQDPAAPRHPDRC
ncbi:MAG: IS3 family transposase, partial [Actinomycetota bacterium]|nr:IS3 family transposase [Actinomycetota bacterium]